MATGPEHYTEAEDWLTVADNAVGRSSEHVVMAAAVAQGHATLALAAATAMAARAGLIRGASGTYEAVAGMDDRDFEAWDRVAGVQEDDGQGQDDEAYIEPVNDDTFVVYSTDAAGNHTANLRRYDGTGIPADDDQDARAAEYVDYAEAEAVREIRELMDLDAAGVESWEQL